MKGRIEIRPMRIDDLREMYLLGRVFFRTRGNPFLPAWNEVNLADLLARDEGLCLVAVSKKHLAGFIIASLEDTGGIRTVIIRWLCAGENTPAGLRADLLNSLKTTLAERNIEKILIVLPEGNSELIEQYRNFGFTESNRLIIMENFFPEKS